MRIGCGQVSTRDQHPEAQSDALTAAGGERVFTDRASGKLARRPELDEALRDSRAGDQLVVTKLDRSAEPSSTSSSCATSSRPATSTWWS